MKNLLSKAILLCRSEIVTNSFAYLTLLPTKLVTRQKKPRISEKDIKLIRKMRKLAVFDFDHTIVDANTDIVVRNLVSKDLIPESLKKLYKKDGWTSYMQGVFEILHLNGITEENITKAVSTIPETQGMKNLIKTLRDELNYDVIIISDSNSYLINVWLQENGLKDYILRVFTNPAHFNKGVLKIEMYHLQTECKLSTKNLCKGQILEEFVANQKINGVDYDYIMYVGDGSNDFCPILRLHANDMACVRDKCQCLELINTVNQGKPIASTGKTYQINAKLLVWNSGQDILNTISAQLPL